MSAPKTPSRFPEYGSDYSFPAFEEKILAYWKSGRVFERSLENAKDKPAFDFYDGPPFATGLPHYGHILAGAIKDIVPRYWSMRGFRIPRRFGWDCHGLPVEFEMEKTLGLNGSLDIQQYGIGKFNEACRGIVLRYTKDWRETVERMGRWVDMDNDYKTMDPAFMESVWWVFKTLWDKGFIYEGKKVVHYSWRLTAPLSNFEASLNYKDVQDPALTVLFPIASKFDKWKGNTAILAWTTTPWTLPSNLALAIHPKTDVVSYGRYKLETPLGAVTHVILADGRAEAYGLKEKTDAVANADLIGTHYKPLFTCFDDADRKADKAFRVVAADYVSASDGTGIVHQAPAFGEDDSYVCQAEGIRLVDPTDMEAKFTDEAARDSRLAPIVGQFVKDADKHIIKVLKDAALVLKHETIQHAYPFCYRSDTPLIQKAIASWFVKLDQIRPRMIKNNQTIRWVPSHIRDGRFGKWLENSRDWCISRNRFWGTPIPVWRCESCSHREVVGSRKELDALAKRPVPDLHSHFVDDVIGDCPKCHAKASLKRTPEVLDCWFESGSMPYAQAHYPFENKDAFEKSFPADFIAEGLDQTRGWFYTLTILSSALFDKPAFKNCIVNGLVLAEDGKKMSKSLKNYPDPKGVFSKHGADALRLYLMQSPAMHGEELRFSEKGLVELMRSVMLPLWNAYGFFASYANIDAWSDVATAPAESERPLLDRWMLARARETAAAVHASMEEFRLAEVAPLLVDLVDDLTNWYIRLNRDRFWGEADAASKNDKAAAYATLWTTLDTAATLLAPGLPFVAETLHAALRGVSVDALAKNPNQKSVHEMPFAGVADTRQVTSVDREILAKFRVAKSVILLGRSLRGDAKIGLRQPLPGLRVAGVSGDNARLLNEMKSLVLKEVNVKTLELVEKASDLVVESAKPNFKTLGRRVGGSMKDIQATLGGWDAAAIAAFEAKGHVTIAGHDLSKEDVVIARQAKPGRFAAADRGLVVELDTALTDELVREGLARELINRVQQRRKESKFHLADRIRVRWWAKPGSLVESVLKGESNAQSMLAQETLAVSIEAAAADAVGGTTEDLGAEGSFSFAIERV